jgi:hypothetical protein
MSTQDQTGNLAHNKETVTGLHCPQGFQWIMATQRCTEETQLSALGRAMVIHDSWRRWGSMYNKFLASPKPTFVSLPSPIHVFLCAKLFCFGEDLLGIMVCSIELLYHGLVLWLDAEEGVQCFGSWKMLLILHGSHEQRLCCSTEEHFSSQSGQTGHSSFTMVCSANEALVSSCHTDLLCATVLQLIREQWDLLC